MLAGEANFQSLEFCLKGRLLLCKGARRGGSGG